MDQFRSFVFLNWACCITSGIYILIIAGQSSHYYHNLFCTPVMLMCSDNEYTHLELRDVIF